MAEEREKVSRFAVELGKLEITEEQANEIQNEIARVVAERVKGYGAKAAAAFGQWGSFGRWVSFGRATGPIARTQE